MKDTIKDLDAALTAEGETTDDREEYPNASEQSIETARQIGATKKRVKAVQDRIEREIQRRERQKLAQVAACAQAVEDLKVRVASITADFGIATEEEKQLLKTARQQRGAEQQKSTDLAAYFNQNN